ncbi:MAG: hypothetical protein M2R45_02526 [Verrucomicrobia subdivision 3 bacterium]|nr:hypothetical protein [Limisphaerales bacterium]MCS1414266.1 hypothetical protein [Limisphaerales bacterium]
MLLPSLNAAKNKDHRAAYISNLRQFGIAMFIYTDDREDELYPSLFNPEKIHRSQLWWPYRLFEGTDDQLAGTENPFNHGHLGYVAEPNLYFDPGLKGAFAELEGRGYELKHYQND